MISEYCFRTSFGVGEYFDASGVRGDGALFRRVVGPGCELRVRAVANAAINYNNAYSAYVVAEATSRALYLGFSAAYIVAENYMSDWLGQYY